MSKLNAIQFASADELSGPGIDIRFPVWRLASCAPIAKNAGEDRMYLCGLALSCHTDRGMSVMACDGFSLQIHEGFASGASADSSSQWSAPLSKGVYISCKSPLFAAIKLRKNLKHWFRIHNGRASVTEFNSGGTEFASCPVAQLALGAEYVKQYAETDHILKSVREKPGELSGEVVFGVNPQSFALAAGIPDPHLNRHDRNKNVVAMQVKNKDNPIVLTRPADVNFMALMMPVRLDKAKK